MKISELIGKLQKAKDRYGDIEVTIDSEEIRDSAVFDKASGGYQFLVSTSEAE